MANEESNVVLEHLRHIRAVVDRISYRLDDLTERLASIETRVAETPREIVRLDLVDIP